MHFNAIPIRGDFEKATKMDAESAEHHVHRPTIGDITRFGDCSSALLVPDFRAGTS